MDAKARTPATLAFTLALTLACTGEKKPEAPAPAPPPPPAAAPAPAPAPPPAPEAAPPVPPAAAPAPAAPAPTPAPKPKETAAPPPPAPAAPPREAAPAPATPPAPAAAAHARVGPEKCKPCHNIQYRSWAASPHAAKGLDCEGCHGNGADYMGASVMRDREKAVAAGLVVPTLAACRKCHETDEARFQKAHAHKVK